MKIAAYAICKNETKHVKRWLEAHKDANVMVIVDTGSEDNTWDVLMNAETEYDNLQIHRITVKPWRFDTARNAALALVPDDVDVCVSIDMDEMCDAGFFQEIREKWQTNSNRAWYPFFTGSTWRNNKVHSRWNWQWTAPIHEVLEPYGGLVLQDVELNTMMRHVPDESKSRGNYLPMLRDAVKERPHDARMAAYLVRELFFHEQWQEIANYAKQALKLGGWYVEQAAICRAAGKANQELGKPTEAERWFRKGTKLAADQMEAWFSLAQFYYERRNWAECLKAASYVEVLSKPDHYLVDQSVWSWRAFDLISIALWNLGMRDESKKYAELAYNANPNDERLESNLKVINEILASDSKAS